MRKSFIQTAKTRMRRTFISILAIGLLGAIFVPPSKPVESAIIYRPGAALRMALRAEERADRLLGKTLPTHADTWFDAMQQGIGSPQCPAIDTNNGILCVDSTNSMGWGGSD